MFKKIRWVFAYLLFGLALCLFTLEVLYAIIVDYAGLAGALLVTTVIAMIGVLILPKDRKESSG